MEKISLMEKNNLWICSDVFYPDQVATSHILTEIAKINLDKFNINVITGPSNYQSQELNNLKDLNSKIIINRINYPKSKNNLILRIIFNIYFAVRVFITLFFKLRKSEYILSVTNPPLLMGVFFILKKIKKINYILIVHDLFPDNSLKAGLINKWLFNFLNYFFIKFYKSPDKITVLGNDMKNFLVQNKFIDKNKIIVIPNWSDNDLVKSENFKKIGKKIKIQFAGNHGRVQGLETLLNELQNLKSNNIIFNFYGDGAIKKKLISIKNELELSYINFFPSFNRLNQQKFLSDCDIGLVTLMPGFSGLGVPSKTYNLLAAGKPILYIGDKKSEIDIYIKKWDVGWSFAWSETKELISFLNNIHKLKSNVFEIKSQNCKDLAKNVFDKNIVLKKYKLNRLINL